MYSCRPCWETNSLETNTQVQGYEGDIASFPGTHTQVFPQQ